MFERFQSDRVARSRRARWIGTVITVSALVHLGAGAALLISAMWHIEKLSPELDVSLAMTTGIPSAAPPPPAGEAKTERAEKPTHKVDVKDVQPRNRPNEPEIEKPGDPHGKPDGMDNGIPDGTGKDPNSSTIGDPCQSALGCIGTSAPQAKPEAAPLPARDKPKIVGSAVLEGQRIKGDPQIHPAETTRTAMLRSGTSRTQAVVKLCLDTTGAPSSVNLVKSSGYPEYDAHLRAEIRTWRYRPYRLEDGTAIAVCTAIVFRYEMK